MSRQADRFRAAQARRERAINALELALLREAWDSPSQVYDRQSQVHLPPAPAPAPAQPPVVSAGSDEPETERRRGAGMSDRTKQIIFIVATAIGGGIVTALQQSGATSRPEPPPKTAPVTPVIDQPGP